VRTKGVANDMPEKRGRARGQDATLSASAAPQKVVCAADSDRWLRGTIGESEDIDRAVRIGGGAMPAIRCSGGTRAGTRNLPARLFALAGAVPDDEPRCRVRHRQRVAVRAKRQQVFAGVVGKGRKHLARLQVPELDDAVSASGSQMLAGRC